MERVWSGNQVADGLGLPRSTATYLMRRWFPEPHVIVGRSRGYSDAQMEAAKSLALQYLEQKTRPELPPMPTEEVKTTAPVRFNDLPEICTTLQVAKFLQVCSGTVIQNIKAGKLAGILMGRKHYRVRRSALLDFLNGKLPNQQV